MLGELGGRYWKDCREHMLRIGGKMVGRIWGGI